MSDDQTRRIRQLEDENSKLKEELEELYLEKEEEEDACYQH